MWLVLEETQWYIEWEVRLSWSYWGTWKWAQSYIGEAKWVKHD